MSAKEIVRLMTLAVLLTMGVSVASAQQKADKPSLPNILVIMGDDIGYWNLSTYNQGMLGFRTPNIDSIANDGMKFTDAYAENSCTAGRSAFITGESPFRTGLLKVGLPGAKEGLSDKDPTLAELLKPLGYTSGQFGKNHLGDRNEFLPTVHGFDEFLGNLYHLNAEEEPEQEFYPKEPAFWQKFGPRGVLHCYATDSSDSTVDPRFGVMGKQKCTDTGPLTRKRMETTDDEFLKAGIDFMDRANKAGKPFLVWSASTRMHIFTRLKPESRGKTGLGVYADGMVEHDGQVGQWLAELNKLGIANNTIVIYTTDNGAELLLWPDGGMTPFHGEKNTTWDGGFRVPMLVKWPGHIKPGTTSNDIISLLDWMPTLMAAVGQPDIKDKLMKGYTIGDKTYKVHLDGYDQTPMLTGNGAGARKEFFYFTDDGSLSALRYNNWKMMFSVQRAHGFDVWQEPYVTLRVPMLFNLRMDPFERAEESEDYPRWRIDNAWAFVPAQAIVGQFLQTFREFPPRAKPGSFQPRRGLAEDAATVQQLEPMKRGKLTMARMQLVAFYLLAAAVLPSVGRAQEAPVFAITQAGSSIAFNVKASVAIQGTFDQWDATLTFTSPDVTTGVLAVNIQAASVDTGSGFKDSKLKSDDFFAVDQNPLITFKSTKIVQTGPNTFEVDGNFTIRGVTKPEKLTLAVSGQGTGSGVISGTMAFDRKDYGMNSGIPFIKIANRVEVTVSLKGNRVSGPPLIFKR